MKNAILILSAVLSFNFAKAQIETTVGMHDFELYMDLDVHIDTANPQNCWEVGTPTKTFFNSAYSVPNSIVTKLSGSYPAQSNSSWTLKIDANALSLTATYIEFWHKRDIDSTGGDLGTIEASHDGGLTWYTLTDSSTNGGMNHWNNWATPNMLPLRGKENWSFERFTWQWYFPVIANPGENDIENMRGWPDTPDSLLVRFRFVSDTISTQNEGWMIDDLLLGMWYASDLKEVRATTLKIYPSIASDELFIHSGMNNSPIFILNIMGEKISEIKPKAGTIRIDLNDLTPGVYFVSQNGVPSKKFVKVRG